MATDENVKLSINIQKCKDGGLGVGLGVGWQEEEEGGMYARFL